MTDRTPVSLSEADIAAVRSWVIHEDEAVIAFNKPAGLSSQGGRIQAGGAPRDHLRDYALQGLLRATKPHSALRQNRMCRECDAVLAIAQALPHRMHTR